MTQFWKWYCLALNLLAFGAMFADKRLARAAARRIPERVLLGLALAGGCPGAMLGMFAFRHKTRKPRFYIGLPLILIAQIAALYALSAG